MMDDRGHWVRTARSVLLLSLLAASPIAAQATGRQQVFFFKQVFGGSRTVIGVMGNLDQLKTQLQEIDQAVMSYQAVSKYANVKSDKDMGKALRDLVDKKVEAILLVSDPVVTSPENRKYLIQECMLKRIPVIGDTKEAVEAGALYALQVTEGRVVALINLRAAKALNFAFPASLLQEAQVVVQE